MTRSQQLAILYVVIAVLSTIQSGLHEGMTAFNWINLSVAAAIGGGNALRSFWDKTSGEQSASDKAAASGQIIPGLPPPTPPLVAPQVLTQPPILPITIPSETNPIKT